MKYVSNNDRIAEGWTYKTSASAEGHVGRDGVQPIDNGFEMSDQSKVAILEFMKCQGLLLEYREDRIRGRAFVEYGGDRVVSEILACGFGKLGQSGFEEGFEVGGSGGCIRYGVHAVPRGVGRCE